MHSDMPLNRVHVCLSECACLCVDCVCFHEFKVERRQSVLQCAVTTLNDWKKHSNVSHIECHGIPYHLEQEMMGANVS